MGARTGACQVDQVESAELARRDSILDGSHQQMKREDTVRPRAFFVHACRSSLAVLLCMHACMYVCMTFMHVYAGDLRTSK